MSFIKNKFRALYMASFIIFTVIFTIMMPDGHTAMWFAMLTALLGTVSTVMFAQKNIWAYVPSFVFNFMYMYICWESRLWLEFDESPMAYKPSKEIIENIKDSCDIVETIKPVYNFKASE